MSHGLFAFYGDDFTGSVDALLQFARSGLRGRLFVGLPGEVELAQAADGCDVVGVAGIARSLPRDQLDAELTPVLEAFARLGVRVVQYKACSTADSSPTIGSIGRAIELGRRFVPDRPVPMLFAQPDFGRYTVFGHHFAAEDGRVYRLDRQPTMSTHPVTPMHESDLTLHLSKQTALPITHLPFTEYGAEGELTRKLTTSAAAAVLLDAFDDEQLPLIGAAILSMPAPVFAVGSGGLSRALARAAAAPSTAGGVVPQTIARPGPTLAVSGSRSGQTQRQFAAAQDAGWHILPLPVDDEAGVSDTARATIELLSAGHDVALSSFGAELGPGPAALPAIAAGAARIIAAAADAGVIHRVIVCGGDTSSRVTRLLGIRSLSIAANPSGNVVLLSAHAPGSALDGIELMLKGGQIGDDGLFQQLRELGA